MVHVSQLRTHFQHEVILLIEHFRQGADVIVVRTDISYQATILWTSLLQWPGAQYEGLKLLQLLTRGVMSIAAHFNLFIQLALHCELGFTKLRIDLLNQYLQFRCKLSHAHVRTCSHSCCLSVCVVYPFHSIISL